MLWNKALLVFIFKTLLTLDKKIFKLVKHLAAALVEYPHLEQDDKPTLHDLVIQFYESELEQSNQLSRIEELLMNDAADVDEKDDSGNTALHHASIRSNGVKLVELLLRFNSDVNVENCRGDAPLTIAARQGHLEIMRLLLDNGANVDKADYDDDSTPLHLACLQKEIKMVKLLLARGADVNALDHDKETPLMWAAKTWDDKPDPRSAGVLVTLLKEWPRVNEVNLSGLNVLDVSSDEQCDRVILEHLAKMAALDLPVDESFFDSISLREERKCYFARCKKEALFAQSRNIHPDYRVNFFNLVTEDARKLVNYAGNKDLIERYRETDLSVLFPIYGTTMNENMTEAVKKRSLLDQAAKTLSKLIPATIPGHLVLSEVLDYLDESDLNNLCLLNSE